MWISRFYNIFRISTNLSLVLKLNPCNILSRKVRWFQRNRRWFLQWVRKINKFQIEILLLLLISHLRFLWKKHQMNILKCKVHHKNRWEISWQIVENITPKVMKTSQLLNEVSQSAKRVTLVRRILFSN